MDPIHVRYLLAIANVGGLSKALELYRADCGVYPKDLQGLVNEDGVEGWRGTYITKGVPLDPWGRPFLYLNKGDTAVPEILSYGADGKPGGRYFDADISSRDLHRPIPNSPLETRNRWFVSGIWLGAWVCFGASIFLLHRTSRPKIQSNSQR